MNGDACDGLLAAVPSVFVAACDGVGDEALLWIVRCSLTWGGSAP